VTRSRESSAAFIRFAKLFTRALHFFNLHFFCNLNVEPPKIRQLACFLFGGLCRFKTMRLVPSRAKME
jgi:hypothetical protein